VNGGRLIILNLHGIGPPGRELSPNERELWINERAFGSVLDVTGGLDGVELTFDDSNESDVSIALPRLKERRRAATFFLIADRVNQPGYLSRRQIETLVEAGMRIGNHGMRHRPWTGLNPQEFHEELVEARSRLQQITGRSIEEASCPFGGYNRQTIRELRRAGYARIYTSDSGPACRDSFVLPRNSVRRSWDVTTIRRIVSDRPRGLRAFVRQMKLFLKRWR
jgi:peptidoglycan/xylan/chitin deacetylase (PgdA/CDA1 family)